MIDFAKIKQRMEQLSGNRRSSLWSPKAGNEYNLRILPWPSGSDGDIAIDRTFYYNIGGGRALLAPSQFGKQDPIQDLINKLRAEGTPGALDLCKQLYPKRRYYVPVVVRGEEDQGVRLWSFGKTIYESLLSAIMGDFGDITDVKEGRDVKVVCKQVPGKQFAETSVSPRVQTSPAGNAKQLKEWLTSVPDLDEVYQLPSADEIEKRVNEHLKLTSADGTEHDTATTNGDATSTGTKSMKNKTVTSTDVSSSESTSIEEIFNQLDSDD